ncbi:DUF721 domain-containing protein [Phycicoccus duodecadis]|uniref:Putative nucleic acid-binding Zn ribbon protein n=1 Tax=Phycicoccus duodecadis TaxID=173053 RepID=A0A2N3YMA0_9MICO|nr:DciA family protein [Phycicoccus duodecadis]PKW27964.1 putative nucleic acid-binding Zn ribbon protein [Phycicoccus duodecadis]
MTPEPDDGAEPDVAAGDAGDAGGAGGAGDVADAAEPEAVRPEVADPVLATAEALARARAGARAKGLRPGLKPRRRQRDVPADRRKDGGRDPQLLGDQIGRFVAERGWAAEVAVGSVIGRWPAIVGPEVAAHCHPTDFADGVLTVRADSTAWATQLRMLETSLMGRLAEDVGEGTVTELRIVGPSAPPWSRGRHRVQDGRGPRDTYG